MIAPDDFDFSGAGQRVRITAHARQQWRDRVDRSTRYGHPLNENTWRRAEVVYAPEANCDESRLYQIRGHRDMLLCGHHYPNETVVATVLYADHGRLARR